VSRASFELLRACAREQPPDRLAELLGRVDGDELLRQARGHGMLSALAVGLRDVPAVDAQLRATLEGWYHRALAGHMRALGDTAAACAALESAGVPVIVSKGPVLAEAIYPRPDLRSYNDVDLFLPRRRFGDGLAALETAGCRVLDRNWALIRRQMRGQLHASAPHGTPLDVHWHLFNHRATRQGLAVRMDELFERRRMVSIGVARVATFEATDTLLTLSLHAAVGGGARLSWLRDVDYAIRREPPDWDTVVARARAWRCGALVGVVLGRAQRVLGTPVPCDVLAALRGGRTWAALLRGAELISPPELSPQRVTLSWVLTNATRDQTLRSAAALAAKMTTRAEKGNVLESAGDESDRAGYFAALAA
jgi:hypothetical protein